MSDSKIVITSDNFEALYRCLSILKDICSDADINEGIIRQRTTNVSCVFEMDLTAILSSAATFPLTSLKQKLDLMKPFIGNDVTMTMGKEDIKFADQYSEIKLKRISRDYLDNKFIDDKEMEKTINLDEDDVILRSDISNIISERIAVASNAFHVEHLTVHFEGEQAKVTAKTQSKEQSAVFMKNIITEKEIECTSNLPHIPFIIDHDGEIEFKMYHVNEESSINKFSTYVGDIPVNVYSRSRLEED